jgi:hypothetical protein
MRRGEPIPRLEYNADEHRVWSTVLQEVAQLYPEHACAEFLRCFPLFNFRPEEVPPPPIDCSGLSSHAVMRRLGTCCAWH